MNALGTAHSTALRSRRGRFGRRFVKAMVAPPTVPFLFSRPFLSFFVCEIVTLVLVRSRNILMTARGVFAPNFSQLLCCFVDDRRVFGFLSRRQFYPRAVFFLTAPA